MDTYLLRTTFLFLDLVTFPIHRIIWRSRYTNAATTYEGIVLFFPAIYYHFDQHGHPWNLTGHGCDAGEENEQNSEIGY